MPWEVDSGEDLRALRKRAKLSVQSLVDLAGVSWSLATACEGGKKPLSLRSRQRFAKALLEPEATGETGIPFAERRRLAAREWCLKVAEEAVVDQVRELLRAAESGAVVHSVVLEFEEVVSDLKARLKLSPSRPSISVRALLRAQWKGDQEKMIRPVRLRLERIYQGERVDEDGTPLPRRNGPVTKELEAKVTEHDERVAREFKEDRVLRVYFRKRRDLDGLRYEPGMSLDRRIKLRKRTSFSDYWRAIAGAFESAEEKEVVRVAPSLSSMALSNNRCRLEVESHFPDLKDDAISTLRVRLGVVKECEAEFKPYQKLKLEAGTLSFVHPVRVDETAGFCLLQYAGTTVAGRNFETAIFACDHEGWMVELPEAFPGWKFLEKQIWQALRRKRRKAQKFPASDDSGV